MKKALLIFVSICYISTLQAQITKTLQITTAGTLNTTLTTTELSTVTDLTLTGSIDARDFKTMRDSMPVLANIDLSGASIFDYIGPYGTDGTSENLNYNAEYFANEIPEYAFYFVNKGKGKISLAHFAFPYSITKIRDYAFSGCSSLTGQLIIPSSVTYLGTAAFANCIGITGTLNFPSSINEIMHNTFTGCSGFKGALIFPSNVTYVGNGAFNGCNGFDGELKIPSSCTFIADTLYQSCTNLTSIKIPSSIKYIGKKAFNYCTKVKSIYVDLTTPIDLSKYSSYVFGNVSKSTCILYVPSGSKALYQAANQWKDFANIIEITTNGNNTTYTIAKTACGSYTLNDSTYTQSGTYTQTFKNIAGADSILTLNLTINQPSITTQTITAYNYYTMNGITYTNSGIKTQILTNSIGCDSVVTLNLTIIQATSSTITQTVCGSYTLNDSIYTKSGTYTQTLKNIAGGDSIITLNLTINPPSKITIMAYYTSVCSGSSCILTAFTYGTNSYTYVWSNKVNASTQTINPIFIGYPNKVNYSVTGTDMFGCTDTASILVTVNPLPTPIITPEKTTACNTDSLFNIALSPSINSKSSLTCSYPAKLNSNNQFVPSAQYEVAGIYTLMYKYTDDNGCTNTATSKITVNPSPTYSITTSKTAIYIGDSVTITAPSFDSYLWNTLDTTKSITKYPTTTTSYSVTVTNSYGCSLHNLDGPKVITVLPKSTPTSSLIKTVCGSYTLNDTTYTHSGNYSQTIKNITGGDSIITLILTINTLPSITITKSKTSIENGETISLTGNGGSSYLWNTSSTTTEIIEQPTVTTTYSVTGTDINGCSNSALQTINVLTAKYYVDSIMLSSYSETINIGDSKKVFAQVQPVNATDPSILWTSSDTSIAIISSTGVVTALQTGNVIIKATSSSNPNISKTVNIIIFKPIINVVSITITSYSNTINIGESKTFYAQVQPLNATDPSILWTSSDTSIAIVSSTGVVTALQTGNVIITAMSSSNPKISKTVNITIFKPIINVDSITITSYSITLNIGESKTFIAQVQPLNATDPSILLTSSDTSIAIVSSTGVVTALQTGNVIIKATSSSNPNISKTVIITIFKPIINVDSITITSYSNTLNIGESKTFYAQVQPVDATDPSILWTSSDTSIAIVSSTGVVIALQTGNVNITVMSVSNKNISKTITITIFKSIVEVKSISLLKELDTINLGETKTINSQINPANATEPSIIWSSSDTNIASVSTLGVITALQTGNVFITATSVSNPTISKTVNITINKPIIDVVSISFFPYKKTMNMGELQEIYTQIQPVNVTVPTLMWLSSDTSIAKISSTGVVTALKPGIVIIKSTSVSNPTISIDLTITIVNPIIDVVSIILSNYSDIMNIGKTNTIYAQTIPANATNPSIQWSSSDTSIAKVSTMGEVIALQPGNVNITATSVANPLISNTIKIEIKSTYIKVESVSFDSTAITTSESVFQIKTTVLPLNATDKSLIWSSSNYEVLSWTNDVGIMFTNKPGVCMIKATSKSDTSKFATIQITIIPKEVIAVKSITLTPSKPTSIFVGDTVTFITKVLPTNANDTSIQWSSSDVNIATVTNGIVLAKNAGTVIITANSVQNPSISAIQTFHISQLGNIVFVGNAGELNTLLPKNITDTISYLKITGTIDARDFSTMRNSMPMLKTIDLSGATIIEYNGSLCPNDNMIKYEANAVPSKAFYNSKLSTILLPKIQSIESYAFSSCLGLNSFEIPSSVLKIDTAAFDNCSNVTTLSIPASVTSISERAFIGCSGLISIHSNSKSPIDLTGSLDVFKGIPTSTCTLVVPFGSKAAYQAANQWKDFTNILEIDGYSISDSSILLSNIANIPLTATVNSNTNWTAVSDKTWLTITPSTANGSSTISFTSNQTNNTIIKQTATVTISAPNVKPLLITVIQAAGDGVKSLMILTNGLCSALTEQEKKGISKLTISGSIDARDFRTMKDSMPNLTEVDLTNANIVAYSGNNGSSKYILDYPANQIPSFAFCNENWGGSNDKLTSFNFPTSCTSIGECAFNQCYGMQKFYIPSTIDSIGKGVFNACGDIIVDESNQNYISINGVLFNKNKSILIYYPIWKPLPYKIPNSVSTIGYGAMTSYGNTYLILPPSIKKIQRYAFSFSGLTSITLPASITEMEQEIFIYSNQLKSIYSASKTPIDLSNSEKVFGDNFNTLFGQCILYVPIGSKVVYQAANQWQNFANIIEIPFDTVKTLITTAGQVSANITETDRHIITSLVLKGTIDVRDIYFIRDSLPYVKNLDLSNVTIVAYEGDIDSSLLKSQMSFSANSLPPSAFKNKVSLEKLILPTTLTEINDGALLDCQNITSIVFNNNSTENILISTSAFNGIDKNNCTIIVPKGTESAYGNVDGLEEFSNIEENTTVSSIIPNPSNTSEAIVLYPNPTNFSFSLFNVDFAKVEIFDITGKLIFTTKYTKNEIISVVRFSPGIYEIKIITDKSVTTKTLVVIY